MAIEVVKMHPALGAEIRGVDLSKPLDAQTAAEIRRAFDENIVVVARGQTLDEQQQLRAAARRCRHGHVQMAHQSGR